MSEFVQIYWTCGNVEEARQIAQQLVVDKLVACAHILPHVESVFVWEGKLETAQETTVILKTTAALFQKVRAKILELATYQVPEILQLSITEGHEEYLDWVRQTVSTK